MTEPDPAILQHTLGDFSAALQHRLANLQTMEPHDPRRPGELGTIAMTYDRLDRRDLAVDFASRAFDTEARAPAGESSENAGIRLDQQPSTQLNAGIVFLREAARLRRERHDDRAMQTKAEGALAAAGVGIFLQQRNGRFHQHEINAASRFSNLEAVSGRPARALSRALGAIGLGLLSESPLLVDRTSGFSWRESPTAKVAAKAKAVYRGLGAVGVALLAVLPGQKAADLRDKVLLKTS